MLIKQHSNCSLESKDSLVDLKPEPSVRNSFGESNFIEFQSPFFVILRVFLQPFFIAHGIVKALSNTISPQYQNQETGAQTDNAENKFAPNTVIDADPPAIASMPTCDKGASASDGITDAILLGTNNTGPWFMP